MSIDGVPPNLRPGLVAAPLAIGVIVIGITLPLGLSAIRFQQHLTHQAIPLVVHLYTFLMFVVVRTTKTRLDEGEMNRFQASVHES